MPNRSAKTRRSNPRVGLFGQLAQPRPGVATGRDGHALMAARTRQASDSWQDKYKLRAGVEGTINQALDSIGIRHARYRGLAKTRLQHVFSAIALNLVRLHTWWTEHPLPAARTSNLQRLDHALAA